jgi:hypothetical protein
VKVAVIGEGLTEYACLPTIAGRLNNVVVKHVHFRGCNAGIDWRLLFERRVVPLVIAVSFTEPEKIVVVLDREDRAECPSVLALQGLEVIQQSCSHRLAGCSVSVVVSNREFETMLFADYEAVVRLPFVTGVASRHFPASTDCQNVLSWIRGFCKPGYSYDKPRDGKFLAQRINLQSPEVLARSRALRKLVKELT